MLLAQTEGFWEQGAGSMCGRKIHEATGGRGKLHNKELHDLHLSNYNNCSGKAGRKEVTRKTWTEVGGHYRDGS